MIRQGGHLDQKRREGLLQARLEALVKSRRTGGRDPAKPRRRDSLGRRTVNDPLSEGVLCRDRHRVDFIDPDRMNRSAVVLAGHAQTAYEVFGFAEIPSMESLDRASGASEDLYVVT